MRPSWRATRSWSARSARRPSARSAPPRCGSDTATIRLRSHDGRIARVGVDAARRASLVAGSLGVVRSHGQYFVVPAEALERIREREPRAIASHQGAAPAGADGAGGEADPEDPYAQYKVPDDLMW